ncbi:MAG: phosphate/phosphite/phosphonate ABC transporter substrate-binding protein [Phormidesmis sp.]
MKRRNFIGYSLLFLGGCTATKTATPNRSTTQPNAQPNQPSQLRFAVTDISGLDDLKRDYEAFRAALEAIIGIPVTFYPVSNYLAAAPALLANDLDLAFAGPSEYLLLRARAQAEPLVAVTRQNYRSMIMVRTDSDITTLRDLQGKTIAMRAEGSTAGHIFPMKLLMDAGLDPDNDFKVKMLNRDAFAALQAGEVDAWTDSYDRYVEFVKNPGLEGKEITLIKEGDNLPGDVFVANPSLGQAFIEKLSALMLSHKDALLDAITTADANKKYIQSTLSAAKDNDYDTMRNIYRAINLESVIQ